jgi:hypothetical protein
MTSFVETMAPAMSTMISRIVDMENLFAVPAFFSAAFADCKIFAYARMAILSFRLLSSALVFSSTRANFLLCPRSAKLL